jgi:hypothetical protein
VYLLRFHYKTTSQAMNHAKISQRMAICCRVWHCAVLTLQSCAGGRRARTRNYSTVLKALCNQMRRYAPLVHLQRLLHGTIFKHLVLTTKTSLPVHCKSSLLKRFCRTVSMCTKNCAQFINTASSQLARYAVSAAKYLNHFGRQ